MLPSIRELLFRGESCCQLAAKIRGLDVGTVVVGTAYHAYDIRLVKAASAFHARYPGISVQLQNGYSSQLLERLEQRRIDLCVISHREGAHDWLPLRQDELMAWVPSSHPLAKLPAVPLSAFAAEPYIDTYPGMDIDNARVFAKCGIVPNTCFSTMDSFATYSMVEAGLGISMNNALNRFEGNGAVKVLPLSPPQTVEIGIAVSHERTPATAAFLAFIREDLPRATAD
jgi:DNA-binding transcriptional LysR family regulator